MDVSKVFVKMCDCPEIQGKIHNWRDGKSWSALIEERDEFIWLPRQDQIQEMLPENKCKCPCCLIFHFNKFVADNIDGLADGGMNSMEQYWLAFYMSEKHQKFWDGKKWRKSE